MEKNQTQIGNYAPDFELKGIDEKVHHLASYLKTFQGIAVVFMKNSCPYVDLYINRLKKIQETWSDQGFTLIGINSEPAKSGYGEYFEEMKQFGKSKNLNFPYLRDTNQDVGNCFKVTVTPEVFLIDNQGIIRYQGRIDDCAEMEEKVENNYLEKNIAALLQGKSIKPEFIKAVGTPIEI